MLDVLIVHTTLWPKVSVSLTKKKTFFVYTGKIHASESFRKIYPLKYLKYGMNIPIIARIVGE